MRTDFGSVIAAMVMQAVTIADDDLLGEVVLGVEYPITVSLAKPPRGFVADAGLGMLRHKGKPTELGY